MLSPKLAMPGKLSSRLASRWMRRTPSAFKIQLPKPTSRHTAPCVSSSSTPDAHSEGLRKLPFAAPNESYGVWLLTHPDLRRSGRVRALFDFVAKSQGERTRA